jgi:translocation and assembly module TamA
MRAVFALAALASTLTAPAFAQAQSPVVIIGVEAPLAQAIGAVLTPREPPETAFQAERLAAEAAERALVFLRSEGYYQAEVRGEAETDPPAARIIVRAGPQFVLAPATLVYEGDPPEAEGLAAAQAVIDSLAQGAPAKAQPVLEAETALVAALQQAGYADATLLRREAVVDHATGTMQVSFTVNAGALVRLGGVRTADAAALSPEAAARFAAWERGEVYTPEALTDLRRMVAGAGAFSQVRVSLAPEAAPDQPRDVILEARPDERRSIEVGVSWSSTDGAGAETLWTRRNGWRRAETLTVGAVLAEQRQALSTSARIPQLGGDGQTGVITLGLTREDQGPYNRDALEAAIAFEAPAAGRWRPSFGTSLAADAYTETAGIENAYVLAAFGEARLDTRDDPLDARRGFEARLRLEPSASFGDAATGFVRATADGRAFLTPAGSDWLTVAARGRLGWIEPVAGSSNDLPTDRLFYAGGGGSVRGYAFNAIFPESRTALGLSPGGRGVLEASVEARARLSERWGVVAFADAGSAFDDPTDMEPLRAGVGLGVRYDLGFAPLRVDVAAPLDRRDADDPFAVYVSIGQAF